MKKDVRQEVFDQLQGFSTPDRPVYLVGGAVRDLLLGKPVHDLDFVLPGETRRLAQEIACRLDGALYVLDEERSTTRVVVLPGRSTGGWLGERMVLDFASLRAPDLEGDLRLRDFTINAMAYDVAEPNRLIDPLGGLADLREKRLRACAPTSLSSDPVRVLRAVRQALGFRLRIDPETLRLMRAAAPLLPRISAERLRDELFRMLDGPQVDLAIRILDQVGGLHLVLPELDALKDVAQSAPHVQDVWNHTLSVARYLEQLLPPLVGQYDENSVADLTVGSAVLWLGRFRNSFETHFQQALVPERSLRALLFFAALYHDIAKPDTRVETQDGKVRFLDHAVQGAKKAAHRARELALSAAEVQRLESVVEHHMRVHFLAGGTLGDRVEKPSRRAIYRFFKDTGVAGVDICLLSLADVRGTYESALPQEVWQAELETCRLLLEAYWEKRDEVISPPRLVSGNDLMQAYGLHPGRVVGKLLAAIQEAQATGEVKTKEEALAFARRWLEPSIKGASRNEEQKEEE